MSNNSLLSNDAVLTFAREFGSMTESNKNLGVTVNEGFKRLHDRADKQDEKIKNFVQDYEMTKKRVSALENVNENKEVIEVEKVKMWDKLSKRTQIMVKVSGTLFAVGTVLVSVVSSYLSYDKGFNTVNPSLDMQRTLEKRG